MSVSPSCEIRVSDFTHSVWPLYTTVLSANASLPSGNESLPRGIPRDSCKGARGSTKMDICVE